MPIEAEVFGTFGLAGHVTYITDDASGGGLAAGGGVAYSVRPTGERFTILPRLDVQRVLTGDQHVTNAQLALLLGGSGERVRVTLGPAVHVLWFPYATVTGGGLSTDLAVLARPFVVAAFLDVGVLGVVDARLGLRFGFVL